MTTPNHPQYQAAPSPHPGSPAPQRMRVMIWLLLLLLALLVLPYVVERVQYALTRGRERAEAEVAKVQLAGLPDKVSVYRLVAKSIAPSVVGVEVLRGGTSIVIDEWSHLRRHPQPPAVEQGSGTIVDPKGYIITNFHVIDGASEVLVRLGDRPPIPNVKVIGADPLSDIAVLKIDAGDLTAAPWGDSDSLQVGDPVMAVGNPFGLARTVTTGIISAKERRGLPVNLDYQDFLQTDAAVNPGNSGGPLVNMKGQVVGINTAIVGQSYQGVGFSIPSRLAREVYEHLKETGKVARGWLGVEIHQLTEPLAEQLGVEQPAGALVAGVIAESPAQKGGIEPGDVIVEFDGEKINKPSDLSLAVARTKVGSKVSVVLVRNGERRKISVVVAERPGQFAR